MVFRRDVEDFAVGPLAVGAEEGSEGSELIPARIELAPFLKVGVLFAGLVEFTLSLDVAVFHAEAADVHCPPGYTAHGEVEAGRDLGLHVFPAGGDVAAPGGRGVALEAGEAGARQQEHTLVGIRLALAVVDCVGVDEGIRVEVFGGGAERGRCDQVFAVLQVGAVADVGLRCVHPPCVDAQGHVVVGDLAPEELAGLRVVGVVE